MDHSAISFILQELNLNEKDMTNIYLHGSMGLIHQHLIEIL
jgi:hypothetical protein